MPKGKRFKKTLNGYTYDLSEGQFQLLKRQSFKTGHDTDWPTQQRVNSLVSQGLIYKDKNKITTKSIVYVRTDKGFELYQALKANLKSSTT